MDDDQCYEEASVEPLAIVEEERYPCIISSTQLERAALEMRGRNIALINSSLRTYFTCFDDIDLNRFEAACDYLISFRSNGSHNYDGKHVLLRPVSILWPTTYENMARCLSHLDSYLINTGFKEKPVEWLLSQNLCRTPICKQCGSPMVIEQDAHTSRDNSRFDESRWQCFKTTACSSFTMPLHRPSFFHGFESIGLKKLLFAVYFWSVATNGEMLYKQGHLLLPKSTIEHIWRRIQNVCRIVVETQPSIIQGTDECPADLVTVQFGRCRIVCAKNPDSNVVRLGMHIEGVSQYSFVELTHPWFAPNSTIRVAEDKFLDLSRHRGLQVKLVSRRDIMTRNNRFDHDSAFGYLITQLAHVFKDFDTTSVKPEALKLVMAEMQWREIYGKTPYESFRHIINHMGAYEQRSDWYIESAILQAGEETISSSESPVNDTAAAVAATIDAQADNREMWAEVYYYAYLTPKTLRNQSTGASETARAANLANINGNKDQDMDVRFQCHLCHLFHSNYQIVNHHIHHVERDRLEDQGRRDTDMVECTHCFRSMTDTELTKHKEIFTSNYHTTLYGCRICCVQMPDRVSFLQHMRRLHFESETPYTCPLCRYSTSSHREILIHFREDHKSWLTALCPFCLCCFTVRDTNKTCQMSKIVNEHINMHYALSRVFSCSNCCLSFLSSRDLTQHKRDAHNPLNVRNTSDEFELRPFYVTTEEEPYCVRAMPVELFVANKKPNLPTELACTEDDRDDADSKSKDQPDDDDFKYGNQDEKSNLSDEIIHVRGITNGAQFLEGGGPNLIEASKGLSRSGGRAKSNSNANDKESQGNDFIPNDYTSEKIKSYLERMPRADLYVPNKSVILTLNGRPSRCIECHSPITPDHFVAQIKCVDCKYKSHCPRALMIHRKQPWMHQKLEGFMLLYEPRPEELEPEKTSNEKSDDATDNAKKSDNEGVPSLDNVQKGENKEEKLVDMVQESSDKMEENKDKEKTIVSKTNQDSTTMNEDPKNQTLSVQKLQKYINKETETPQHVSQDHEIMEIDQDIIEKNPRLEVNTINIDYEMVSSDDDMMIQDQVTEQINDPKMKESNSNSKKKDPQQNHEHKDLVVDTKSSKLNVENLEPNKDDFDVIIISDDTPAFNRKSVECCQLNGCQVEKK